MTDADGSPERLPAGLPPPVERYLETVGAAAPTRAAASGGGAIRQALVGRGGVWLRFSWQLALRPGAEYRFEARVRALGLPFTRLREELVGGRGRLVVARRVFEHDDIDRAECAVLWLWTLLLAPGAPLARADVSFEARGPAEARLIFPCRQEVLEATLRFDGETGLLDRFETMRFEPRAGRPRPWSAQLADSRAIGGALVPTSIVTHWEDEPALRLRLHRVETG